jgi:hypothetical protein
MHAKAVAAIAVFAFLSPSAWAGSWPIEPDHNLTPGKTVLITLAKLCTTKWGTDARKVTAAMKQQVIDEYNFDVKNCPRSNLNHALVRRVEIDHLIPRSLGGADHVDNLWPQCYELTKDNKSQQEDGAHKKDRLELALSARLCNKPSKALLVRYQNKIKNDWLALYHELFGDQ